MDNLTDNLNKIFQEASVNTWEKETGHIHYSRMNWFQKLKYRIKRAYLAFRNVI